MKRLDELDQVPWSTLEHAYGPATDVPALIRDLSSAHKEKREKAIYELHGNIWHQGTVYEATAYAVPFLVGLLFTNKPENRVDILLLLAEIADGKSYIDVHGSSEPNKEARLIREMEWVHAARSAVLAEATVYRKCLLDENEDVSLAAAYLLGTLKGDRHWPASDLFETLPD
jgi:hypothetical protein